VTRIRPAIGNIDVASSRKTDSVHRTDAVTVRPETGGWRNVRTLYYWRAFEIEIERDEDGWFVGTVAELPGCHTQARTEDELIERLHEAVELALTDSPADRLSKALFCPPLPK
jgi:predicted RNase H-like HicB family nuclease